MMTTGKVDEKVSRARMSWMKSRGKMYKGEKLRDCIRARRGNVELRYKLNFACKFSTREKFLIFSNVSAMYPILARQNRALYFFIIRNVRHAYVSEENQSNLPCDRDDVSRRKVKEEINSIGSNEETSALLFIAQSHRQNCNFINYFSNPPETKVQMKTINP
jgi:hypothetical protein